MMKLFYTDRYAAAYMSVHHGLRFIDDNGLAAPYIVVQDNTVRDGERFYIDPEQHHLFKAQDGDVLEVDRFYYDRIRGDVPQDFPCHNVYPTVRTSKRFVSMSTPGVEYDNYFNDQHDDFSTPYKIIMRDGEHFFMPEVEG